MTDDEMSVEYLYEMVKKQGKKHICTTLSSFFLLIHVEAAHNICHHSNSTVVAAKEAKKPDYLVSGKIVQMTSLCKKGEIKGKVFGPCGDRRRGRGPNHTHRYRYQVILVC